MKAAGIVPSQLIHINSLSNAAHWETYAILGEVGVICLNGCPARLFYPGDKVIIMAFALGTHAEAAKIKQKVVHVDDKNKIIRLERNPATPKAKAQKK